MGRCYGQLSLDERIEIYRLHEAGISRQQIAAALDLIQKYQLVSRKRAEQSLSFTEHYRSYVINYGLGQDMVTADLERSGASQAARWQRMEVLLSQPTLPADLRR